MLAGECANSFQGLIRYDHNLSQRLFAYAVFAGGYDELQDLNYRLMPGGGLGLHAIASGKTTLDLLAGFGYVLAQREMEKRRSPLV